MENEKYLGDLGFHEDIEYPWKRCYISLMRPTEVHDILESDCVLSKSTPGFLREHWAKFSKLTLLDPFRMGKLLDLLVATESISGDIVECGSYKGGSGIMMALYLRHIGSKRKIHLFDSFSGLPDPDEVLDKGYKRGQFKSNFEKLNAVIEQLGLQDIITIHKGWFKDTIPKYIEGDVKSVSLFHVDCDLYTSTMDCFPDVYPLVSNGGAIVLDDYNDGGRGEKIAITNYLVDHSRAETIVVSTAPQSYFVKGVPTSMETKLIGGLHYSIEELLDNDGYLTWLKKNIEEDYKLKLEKYT